MLNPGFSRPGASRITAVTKVILLYIPAIIPNNKLDTVDFSN